MTNQQTYRMSMLAREFGLDLLEEEFKYFQEFARHFKHNPLNQRYGILIWGKEPLDENMLYSHDVAELHVLHCELVCKDKNTGHDGMKQRKFIDWLEKMEGKQ